MKVLKYKIRVGKTDIFFPITMGWNEVNEEIAKKEAYNGEYTVEDDGREDTPTQIDRVEAQVTYTAMMTDTLLGV